MKGMRLLPLTLVLGGLLSSCTTLHQKANSIRSSETILFDRDANVGTLLNAGKSIFWDHGVIAPVLATPTTLYFGDQSLSYTSIESVEVGSIHSQKQMFQKEATYEDLMLVKLKSDPWNGGYAFFFLPAKYTLSGLPPNPARRAIAEKATDVIKGQIQGVDVFGQMGSPRPVWLASPTRGQVFELWSRKPLYLNLHFAEQRKAIDALFKAARQPATESFRTKMRPQLAKFSTVDEAFSFVDIGELPIDWIHHNQIRKRLGERNPSLRSLVVLDTLRIWLEEKMDPQGNPSIKVRFSCTARYYDVEISRLASYSSFFHEVTLPLRTWLEGGENRILSEFETAMNVIARKVEASLNDPSSTKGHEKVELQQAGTEETDRS